ncbi:MAG: hydrolase 1, exosortase A system-associated, partial [Thauera sp.]
MREIAQIFPCEGEELIGILALPETAVTRLGVLVVVGGPQYRVGSHRQFVLLARALAKSGVPCMRFDYRGMGDATGEMRD